jgi:hypothetical protein
VFLTAALTSRRWIAGVLAALTVMVSLEPLLHADDGHDPHFAIVVHDASAHRFTAPPPDADPLHGSEHCVVCHLFRQSRNTDSRLVDDDVQLRAVLVAGAGDVGRPSAGSALPLPARAPPARS